MSPASNMVHVEDGISRQRLTALANEGQRPYLAGFRVVQVSRGSEELMVKTELTQTSWTVYSGLTKNTFSAEEELPLRQKNAGIDKSKIETICKVLVPHIAAHKRSFWEEMGKCAMKTSTGSPSPRAAKKRRKE